LSFLFTSNFLRAHYKSFSDLKTGQSCALKMSDY
jgi:hypothetical protein